MANVLYAKESLTTDLHVHVGFSYTKDVVTVGYSLKQDMVDVCTVVNSYKKCRRLSIFTILTSHLVIYA